jgi:hypothetical protein
MSGIRSFRRASYIVGHATPTSVPLYVDSDDNILKLVPAGTGTTEVWIPGYTPAPTGGDSGVGIAYTFNVLTGTSGLRQGAIDINLDRQSTQPFIATWDGNPDVGLNIAVNNRADNLDGATEIGAVRALTLVARNRGTNLAWVQGVDLGVRNDSGKTTDSLEGIHIRLENYGTVNDTLQGLDVELSCENDTSSPVKHGIVIRNTDLSGMAAVDGVFLISHTSTNGFASLIDFTGLTAAAGTIFSTSGTTPTTHSGRIRIILPSGAAGWVPVFSTSNE